MMNDELLIARVIYRAARIYHNLCRHISYMKLGHASAARNIKK